MENKLPLCEQLKMQKIASKMTLRQVCEKSNVPESTISRILSGDTDRPSFEVVAKLVKAMGGSLDVLAEIKTGDETATENQLRAELAATQKELITARQELQEVLGRMNYLKKWLMAVFAAFCLFAAAIVAILLIDRLM